ncbi:MAG: 4-alpha-glucanotransferase [Ruminococcaceae bacterium]|nr:4-alpha-glucanotransferase [Oscillospiraceae bacterium]
MRSSGVLLHITSLPSPHGIGSLGKEAHAFADFLAEAGQSMWQVLPLSPTGYGDSPYQPISLFAGNPLLIDLDTLCEEGWLSQEEIAPPDADPRSVNYPQVYAFKRPLLERAADRIAASLPDDFGAFCRKQSFWLDDYASFAVSKRHNGQRPWWEWTVRKQDIPSFEQDVQNEKILQYLFFRQWETLRRVCSEKGITLIGDLPIYPGRDSADFYAHMPLFLTDGKGNPTEVAGCPPDAFSPTGQKWGNPLYDWDAMRQNGYAFWMERFAHAFSLFDLTRIDHFRGLESFYAIEASAVNAVRGQWRKGPGEALFDRALTRFSQLPLIAEDLGFLTDEVHALRERYGFPGMKILLFAFDSGPHNPYLPHRYEKNCVLYVGTHDNDTILGWAASRSTAEVGFAADYLRIDPKEGLREGMIKAALASTVDRVIFQMQDLLGLDNSARMNTPSKAHGNWCWRMTEEEMSSTLATHLRRLTRLYER